MLSNAQERAWYNSHRDQILRAGSHQAGASGEGQSESPYQDIDLRHYRSRTCFAGFGPDAKGFFAVYGGLFDALAKEEEAAYRRQKPVTKNLKKPAVLPAFGGALS